MHDDYDMGSSFESFQTTTSHTSARHPHLATVSVQASQAGPSNVVNTSVVVPPPISLDIDEFAASWSLNAEQTAAFKIIAKRSLERRGFGDPLRMFLSGPAGTGKSCVFNAVKAYFDAKGQSRRFRVSAFMGIAAKNVGGMMLHAALCMSKGAEHKNHSKDDLVAMWNGVDFLLIDEVSMISCEFLLTISEKLSEAKGSQEPFGGINIIFAGDFAQLPPVLQSRLYSDINTKFAVGTLRKERKVLGRILWLTVNTVIELTVNMRQQGSVNKRFCELLARLRLGQCTNSDYELLKGRITNRSNNIDLRHSRWRFAPVIVSDNTAKDVLNERCAAAFAKATGQTLHWYYATDKCKGSVLENEDLLTYLQTVHSGKTKGRLGRLPLVIGMPVLLSQNFDVQAGVVNGSYGTVKRIRYKTDDNGRRMLISCVVKVLDANEQSMPHLNPNEVPVLRDSIDFTFTNKSKPGQNITIKRTQVPIVPAFAMTAHRAQGQTLSNVIVDLQSCRGSEAPYVMLSRVTSLDGLLILRPFSKKKISCNVSEDLRLENKRLRTIALETINRCADGAVESQAAITELTTLANGRHHVDGHPPSKRASRSDHVEAPLSKRPRR